jgi:hypothetical protein
LGKAREQNLVTKFWDQQVFLGRHHEVSPKIWFFKPKFGKGKQKGKGKARETEREKIYKKKKEKFEEFQKNTLIIDLLSALFRVIYLYNAFVTEW